MKIKRVGSRRLLATLSEFRKAIGHEAMMASYGKSYDFDDNAHGFHLLTDEGVTMGWAMLTPLHRGEYEYQSGIFPQYRGMGNYLTLRDSVTDYAFDRLNATYVWRAVMSDNVQFSAKMIERAHAGIDWPHAGYLSYPGRQQDFYIVSDAQWHAKWRAKNPLIPVL